jgi:OTU domain-containing protein 6
MATHVLSRPIGVWSPGPGGPSHIITYGEEEFPSEPPLHVLWSGAHYDLLIPVAPRSKL